MALIQSDGGDTDDLTWSDGGDTDDLTQSDRGDTDDLIQSGQGDMDDLTQSENQKHKGAEQTGGLWRFKQLSSNPSSPYSWRPQASNRTSLSFSVLFDKLETSISTTCGVLGFHRVKW